MFSSFRRCDSTWQLTQSVLKKCTTCGLAMKSGMSAFFIAESFTTVPAASIPTVAASFNFDSASAANSGAVETPRRLAFGTWISSVNGLRLLVCGVGWTLGRERKVSFWANVKRSVGFAVGSVKTGIGSGVK